MQYYQTPDGQNYAVAGDDDHEFAIGEDFLIDGDEYDDDDYGDDEWDEYGDDDEYDEDDEFGDDLMIGDEDLDPIFGDDIEFGAPRRKRRMRRKRARALSRLRRKALARMAGGFSARRKPVVRQGYKLTLPFSQTFAAATTGTITLTPQRSFRLTELVVGDATSALFQLNALSVGQDNQFIAAGALNMEVFSNLSAQKVALAGSTANLGTTIVLNVTNLDGANPQTLSGMLMGPTVLQVA